MFRTFILTVGCALTLLVCLAFANSNPVLVSRVPLHVHKKKNRILNIDNLELKNFHYGINNNSIIFDDLDVNHFNRTSTLFDLQAMVDHCHLIYNSQLNKSQLTMDKPKVDVDIHRVGKIWFGQESFSVEKMISILANKAGQQQTTVHDLSLSLSHKKYGKDMNIIFHSDADSASNKFHTYGPISTNLKISGINIAALEKLMKHSRKITKIIRVSPRHSEEITSDLLPLVARGLQIHLDTLKMESDVGELQAHASLIIPKQPFLEKPSFAYMLLTMKLDVHIKVSQAMLQQILEDYYRSMLKKAHLSEKTASKRAQEQIKAWADAKIIVAKGDNYQLDLQYSHATMSLNK